MKRDSIKVCYILAYYFPQYVRTKVLLDAFEQLEHTTVYTAVNRRMGLLKYIEVFLKLIKIRLSKKPDIYILGFRGYEHFWIIKLLTLGKPLVYDHMMSPYDSLVFEKRTVKEKSALAKIIHRYEQSLLNSATITLTDSTLHSQFLGETFTVSQNKFVDIPVGADEIKFFPMGAEKPESISEKLSILFYGSFLPLHGVPLILEVAKRVQDLPITFDMIGGNRLNLDWFFDDIKKHGLKNVSHTSWVDYDLLPQRIGMANLCIGGPLGNTGQSSRIITGKTYQFLAMGKPTIVGDVQLAHPFVNQTNCLLIPQGNRDALEAAIRWAFEHQSQLPQIGENGRKIFQAHFSTKHISQRLDTLLQKLV
ncbi:MAG: glycosyltransferase [Chloroflexota bacterium]